jgi:hypothetical protein
MPLRHAPPEENTSPRATGNYNVNIGSASCGMIPNFESNLSNGLKVICGERHMSTIIPLALFSYKKKSQKSTTFQNVSSSVDIPG